jgi:FAD:protein FMN transferase
MNRRDFLRPRRLAHAAGHVLGALDELRALAEAPPPDDVALLRFSRRAMATTFEVLLPFGLPHAAEAGAAVLDEIDRLENQLTVYRDDSEVSRLNRLAPTQAVPVEEGLFGLLQIAQRLHRDTEGAFDITTGALTRAWGFYRRQGRVPEEAALAEARARVGMGNVVLEEEGRTARYLRKGLEINLCGIGKRYALDRAAELVVSGWGVGSALLHGGHSSVYALGSEPGRRDGWAVGVSHPWDRGRRLAVLRLHERGLGTSAATFQYLEYNGRKLGHILDPRTGWPAEGLASASVTAPTAAEADALATAFFILGLDKARAYCAAHPDVGAVLVPSDAATPVMFGRALSEVDLLPSNAEPARVSP